MSAILPLRSFLSESAALAYLITSLLPDLRYLLSCVSSTGIGAITIKILSLLIASDSIHLCQSSLRNLPRTCCDSRFTSLADIGSSNSFLTRKWTVTVPQTEMTTLFPLVPVNLASPQRPTPTSIPSSILAHKQRVVTAMLTLISQRRMFLRLKPLASSQKTYHPCSFHLPITPATSHEIKTQC